MSQDVAAAKWNALSQGRSKWDKVIHAFLDPITTKLLESVSFFDGMHILDVATGTGEPGLTIARSYPNVKVTGIDISETMLSIAKQKAATHNVGNYAVVGCSASSMPFSDASFDIIICRNGVMFFNDMRSGIGEMYRVLKPGGSIHISTWAHLHKNLWIDVVLNAISRISRQKVFRKHIPGMFYCMEPGFVTEWLEVNNLKEIKEEEYTGIISFNSMEEYWQYITSVSSVVVDAISQLDEQTINIVYNEVQAQLKAHIIHERLYLQWSSNITRGYK